MRACSRKCSRKSNSKGFTLIEMLVVAAIISIFATIAIPSYQEFVLKSRRA
ncbi:MAG: prepilin-type N-terminal cleavage/methylation domain-containing protein, partial [Pseudomonadales bacterium]|nr:prepilin-type N-terminal cleavage/methylation domain-containing protein [Pseudomonadales bacterium]